MKAIWPEVARHAMAIERILRKVTQSSAPDQNRWREAMAKLLLVYTMVYICLKCPIDCEEQIIKMLRNLGKAIDFFLFVHIFLNTKL